VGGASPPPPPHPLPPPPPTPPTPPPSLRPPPPPGISVANDEAFNDPQTSSRCTVTSGTRPPRSPDSVNLPVVLVAEHAS